MFSFDLSLYIFIFCLFLHLKLKWVFLNFSYVMLYQNGLVNTGLKLFLFTVRVTFKTMQWVFFFFLQNLAFYFFCEKCWSNFNLCHSVLILFLLEAQDKFHFPKNGCTEL